MTHTMKILRIIALAAFLIEIMSHVNANCFPLLSSTGDFVYRGLAQIGSTMYGT